MPDISDSTHKMTKEEILFQLLRKEYGYYKAILEITKEEYDRLISTPPLFEIKALLKKKKEFMSKITEVETSLAPLKKYWQEKRERSDFVSEQIKQELNQLHLLLQEILRLDLLSQRRLELHMLEMKEQQ